MEGWIGLYDGVVDATEVEMEAVRLRFLMQNPELPAEALPPSEEIPRLLGEVRERVAQIEREALQMLFQKVKKPRTGGQL